MTDAILLRPLGAEEDEIMKIWRTASRVGHPFLTDRDLDAQELLTRREHLPRADIVVAERQGAVVGFIATLGDWIGALFVAPEAQGAGIGRRLVEDAQSQHTALQLNVYEDNHSARGFYARLGFVQVGRSDQDDEGRLLPVLRLVWPRR
jgi:ribosomal protein S18 acetylase RimI-like enzyme